MLAERKTNVIQALTHIDVPSLTVAIDFLKKEKPGIALFDFDYTLKAGYLKTLLILKFGKIESSSLDFLTELKSSNWVTAVVTNQPRHGHQIATLLGKYRNYPYFPKALEDILGEEAVFGGNNLFFLPGNHYKSTDNSILDIQEFILRNSFKAEGGIYVIGDKVEDGEFATRLNASLPDFGLYIKTFLKLPDPLYLSRLPHFVRKLIP